jgi:hypothetical protein
VRRPGPTGALEPRKQKMLLLRVHQVLSFKFFFAEVSIVLFFKHSMLQVPPMQYIVVCLEKLTVAQIILRNFF